MSAAAETIRTCVAGRALIVTIDRPERRNAIDRATAERLEAVWDGFDADPELRVAVLTGAGGHFSAGADLKAAASGAPPARTERRGSFGTIGIPPAKPLIVAVEGDALGGGCELALAADLVVASRRARFGLPECRRGVLAAAGGVIRLPRRLPVNLALEMILTGAPQPAPRLHELGFVNALSEPGQALAAALELATAIAANAPLAVAAAKRVAKAALDLPEAEAWVAQQPELDRLRASEDYREGIAAFAEKRSPEWRGR